MFRKFAALLIGLILICAMMLPAFAYNSDKAFEVVEPTFGKNNEVITKNLLINIRIYEEIPLEMTLVRIEPNITDAVIRDEISSLEDVSAYMMPVLPVADVENIDLSDLEIPYEISDSYEEDERRAIAESYLDTLKEKQSAEEEFLRSYDRYKDLFSTEEAIIVPETLSYYEQEVVQEYKNSLKAMLEMNYIYSEMKPVYESIFEVTVLGPEEVALDGVVPFYRTVVEDIKPGDYKLIFTSEDDVVELRKFAVKELKEDKIKERTTDILQNVLNDSETKSE